MTSVRVKELEISEQVLAFLNRLPSAYSIQQIAKGIHRRYQDVRHIVKTLAKDGQIETAGKGKKGSPKLYHMKGLLDRKKELERELLEEIII